MPGVANDVDARIIGCFAGFEAENILRGREMIFSDAADLSDLSRCAADFDDAKKLLESIPGRTWAVDASTDYQFTSAMLRLYWPAVVALAADILAMGRQRYVLAGWRAEIIIARAIGGQLGGQRGRSSQNP